MNPQIAIPPGPDFVSYEEFAEQFGCSMKTVKEMVKHGDLLLVPRTRDGGLGRINMIAFRARLLAQAINSRYAVFQ
nr:MAG TPA: regulatory protein [Caudoviricetes sp.]